VIEEAMEDMMRTTSYRESPETTRQLEALCERLGENRSRVITRAIDRMYREEVVNGITIIEDMSGAGEYGMSQAAAIIQHPTLGRVYISEGYGGEESLNGGTYRWRHGIAVQLRPDDTSATLDAPWNEHASVLDAMLRGMDHGRPVIDWTGAVIEKVARSAGL
jgi:predicted DNA-binding protein